MDVTHSTFTLERTYAAPVATVFAAWARPDARRRWFAGGAEYDQHFAVGGTERVRSVSEDHELTFESRYHDIASNERILYTSTLSADGALSTVSATSVEFQATEDGASTLLTVTEHGMYLPGQEEPAWRERGTGDQLAALAAELDVAMEES